MFYRKSRLYHNSKSVSSNSDIIGFIALVIITSSILGTITLNSKFVENSSDMQKNLMEANDILISIRNHDKLIYNGQPGNFDINKLTDLDSLRDLDIFSRTYANYVEIVVVDIMELRYIFWFSADFYKHDTDQFEYENIVPASSPVNLQVNPQVIHAAILTVTLYS